MQTTRQITDFAGRSVHSQSQHWCTPPKYVEAVKNVFGGEIALDPCSNRDSIVHAKNEFLLPEADGSLSRQRSGKPPERRPAPRRRQIDQGGTEEWQIPVLLS